MAAPASATHDSGLGKSQDNKTTTTTTETPKKNFFSLGFQKNFFLHVKTTVPDDKKVWDIAKWPSQSVSASKRPYRQLQYQPKSSHLSLRTIFGIFEKLTFSKKVGSGWRLSRCAIGPQIYAFECSDRAEERCAWPFFDSTSGRASSRGKIFDFFWFFQNFLQKLLMR